MANELMNTFDSGTDIVTRASFNARIEQANTNFVNGLDGLDGKAPLASPTFTGTVVLPSTTSIGNVSATELSYVDGVTSAIQTQLNAKLSSLVTYTVKLAADMTIPVNDVWGDVISVSLPAGVYFVQANTCADINDTSALTVRLSTGVTHYASAVTISASPTYSLGTIITLASTTTIKLQYFNQANTTVINAVVQDSSAASGANATQINAIKIG